MPEKLEIIIHFFKYVSQFFNSFLWVSFQTTLSFVCVDVLLVFGVKETMLSCPVDAKYGLPFSTPISGELKYYYIASE